MKRVLFVGICISLAYLLILFCVLMFVAPAPTDEFRFDDLHSPWFRLRVSLGQHQPEQALLAIFAPLGWLLRLSNGDTISWLLILPYVLLLGITVSLAGHGVGALVRRKR